MKLFIYGGSYFCPDCADRISKRLAAGNSDKPRAIEYTDAPARNKPTHCGGGNGCIDAIVLPSGRRVGALLPVPLTVHGWARLGKAHRLEADAGVLLALRSTYYRDTQRDCPDCAEKGMCSDCPGDWGIA